MADFIKTELPEKITYTGINDSSGAEYVIIKDDNNLILEITIPYTMTEQTWQEIEAEMDTKT